MAKLFTYVGLITIMILCFGCEKNKTAGSYLYQSWKASARSVDGVNTTLECTTKGWLKIYSTNHYDAHDGCANMTITNVPYIYDSKTNSITLTTISELPLYVVYLDANSMILEQTIGDVQYNYEFKKM